MNQTCTKTVCIAKACLIPYKIAATGEHVQCRLPGGIVWPSRVKPTSKIWKKRSPASPDGHDFIRCDTIRARFGLQDINTMEKSATLVAISLFRALTDSSLWRTKIWTIRADGRPMYTTIDTRNCSRARPTGSFITV